MTAISAILTSQSQSLATLSLAYNFAGHKTFEHVIFPRLPRLQELTVAVVSSSGFRVRLFSLLPSLSDMPALLRLSMMPRTVKFYPHAIIKWLTEEIPRLTHIRLPIVHNRNLSTTAHLLQECIQPLRPERPSEMRSLPPYPLHIFVQTDLWDNRSLSGSQRQELYNLPSPINSTDSLDFHQRSAATWYYPEEQEQEWRERIVGGDGGWNPGLH
ncbi:hypothetical protein FIBSPDRAFT_924188 [Athelia psychrophila]|uniref:F-box domain-containing protein n=1 Tax=Athelia psychrophila TaxID=1759441 RepID=A0A166WG81_9AGAM|nr:hypothetical protein FIBSPDRAFT_924188 [Fibularhizoctonia sp. CBS 109695]